MLGKERWCCWRKAMMFRSVKRGCTGEAVETVAYSLLYWVWCWWRDWICCEDSIAYLYNSGIPFNCYLRWFERLHNRLYSRHFNNWIIYRPEVILENRSGLHLKSGSLWFTFGMSCETEICHISGGMVYCFPRISTINTETSLMIHEDSLRPKRTVNNECFILAALTTYMNIKPFVLQSVTCSR